MRILFSTSSLFPYRVNWLDELGKYADVDVYYLMDNDNARNTEWCAARPQNCKYTLLKSRSFPKLGQVSFEVKKILKKHWREYDIILLDGYGFTSQMINISYLNKKKIPYYVNIDGMVPSNKKSGLSYGLKKKIISHIPHILSGSRETNKLLLEYGALEENIINHPFTSLYEKDIFTSIATMEEKEALRNKLNITEKNVVISVGRFSYLNGYGKGYDVLIRAAKNMEASTGWYIIGGAPTQEFANMVKQNNLTNVHFVDFLKKDALIEYYRASDVFVLMTVSDVWGLVVNEAMACGLPVITTDKCVAGLDLVNDENGALLRVGDDIGLKEKLEQIFADQELLGRMSKVSLDRIRDYTIENMGKIHINAFLENLKNS